MAGYGLVVRFVLRPDKVEAFDALVRVTVDEIATKEPGTLIYASHAVTDQPLVRIFYELYADEGAFQAHERQPHVINFLAARTDLLETFSVDFLTPLVSNHERG